MAGTIDDSVVSVTLEASKPSSYEALTLESRLTTDQYRQLAAAVTAEWDPEYAADPANKSAVDDVVFRRHDNTVRFILPWIEGVRSLSGGRVVDFGSGCGSSSLAFSHVAGDVHAFEIDAPSVTAFKCRMDMFRAENVQVFEAAPSQILEPTLARIVPGSTVVLIAVVGHLLESERIQYLTAIWQQLEPGDLLVIAETPNFYAYLDTHTFGVPFAHMVPDDHFVGWLRSQPSSLRFRDSLLDTAAKEGVAAVLEGRRRLGIGVSHHTFELAFGMDLNEVVAADGFADELRGWFPMLVDDRLTVTAFDAYDVELPIGFARSVLSFVFRKPSSAADASSLREWNKSRRSEIIAELSFMRQ